MNQNRAIKRKTNKTPDIADSYLSTLDKTRFLQYRDMHGFHARGKRGRRPIDLSHMETVPAKPAKPADKKPTPNFEDLMRFTRKPTSKTH